MSLETSSVDLGEHAQFAAAALLVIVIADVALRFAHAKLKEDSTARYFTLHTIVNAYVTIKVNYKYEKKK